MTSPPLDAARVAARVDPVTGSGYRIGFDIGGTKTLGIVLGPTGEIVARARIATLSGAEGLLDTIHEAARSLASASGLDVSNVDAIGIGIPGLVSARSGVIEHAVNLRIAKPVALARLVRERLGYAGDVRVENDVNVAARGIVEELGLHDRVVSLISVGTGLAAGLVVRGELWRGAAGIAGEIGHVPIDPHGPMCGCGQRGCIEQYASGSALARMWPVAAGQQPASSMFDAADAGNATAVAVRTKFSSALATAIQMIALSVDPDLIVLGGGVASVGEPLRLAAANALRERSRHSAFLRALRLEERLIVASKGSTTAAVGAATLGP
ncbi:putative NBD/HSP70 family sugar kinase [Microbacterium sp. AG1240]|uniref:ROK family protein n=1 Tax=Microbacterium sp. AG1240 TaxID=2183992 RepID=UPI000EAFBFC8|nr:ROK family protein [Microbacterium sp. AG1240]RKT31630.1 putative NBD/HSP70 family sugar kinase [Microbacterium sp. AG1240]